jgi:hypothetical protein
VHLYHLMLTTEFLIATHGSLCVQCPFFYDLLPVFIDHASFKPLTTSDEVIGDAEPSSNTQEDTAAAAATTADGNYANAATTAKKSTAI